MNKLVKHAPLKTFLCHSHCDRRAVHALWSRLKKDSLDVWLDKENLQPGQNWEHEIRMAILKSDIVIACLSQNFNRQSGFRHEELKLALKKASILPIEDIFIIPVRLEKCDPPDSLRHLHHVDLFEADGYKKLIRALHEHMKLFSVV